MVMPNPFLLIWRLNKDEVLHLSVTCYEFFRWMIQFLSVWFIQSVVKATTFYQYHVGCSSWCIFVAIKGKRECLITEFTEGICINRLNEGTSGFLKEMDAWSNCSLTTNLFLSYSLTTKIMDSPVAFIFSFNMQIWLCSFCHYSILEYHPNTPPAKLNDLFLGLILLLFNFGFNSYTYLLVFEAHTNFLAFSYYPILFSPNFLFIHSFNNHL